MGGGKPPLFLWRKTMSVKSYPARIGGKRPMVEVAPKGQPEPEPKPEPEKEPVKKDKK